jgi:Lipase (class 3)/RoxA-like, cytochrome c-like
MEDGMKPFPTDDLKNLLPPINDYTYVPRDSYEYFKEAESHPFKPNAIRFESVNAWWLADSAMLAYSDRDVIEYWCEKAGFKEFHWFNGASTQCFVAATEQYVFVVFRGTQAPGKRQSLRDVAIDWSVDFETPFVEFPKRGRVHSGFWQALDEVWTNPHAGSEGSLVQKLERLHERLPHATFWFTGHSLGAALATVAICRFDHKDANLYTYGSPMVGDREFQRSFDFPAWRFVNDTDIITRAPRFGFYSPLEWPFAGRYHPVGELKFIDAHGYIGTTERPSKPIHLFTYLRAKLRRTRERFANHAPLRYTILIWNDYISGIGAHPPEKIKPIEKPISLIWKVAAAFLLVLGVSGLIQLWVWRHREPHVGVNAVILENGLGSARDEFYTLAEGSEMFPKALADAAWYRPAWFKDGAVPENRPEPAESILRYLDPTDKRPFLDGLERYGFIPVPITPGNPLGYIGLTVAKRAGTGIDMIGVNCAACHVGQIKYKDATIRIDGAPNTLDVFGFILGLKRSVGVWNLNVWELFKLLKIDFGSLSFDGIRTYVDQGKKLGEMVIPTKALYGRADAFGTARSMFFSDFRPMTAPASYPHIWGLKKTAWYHWNANTNSIIERNVGQALGLGAGIDQKDCRTTIKFDYLLKMEELAYQLKAPSWPSELGDIKDKKTTDLIARGKSLYMSHEPNKGCARCHDNYDDKKKDGNVFVNDYYLSSLAEVGTDPNEAVNFAPSVKINDDACDGDNGPSRWYGFGEAHEKVIGGVRVDTNVEVVSNYKTQINGVFNGDRGKPEWKVRIEDATCKDRPLECPVYPAKPLVGIWATAPYLHNGSVPTIWDLLTPPKDRPKTFFVGQREFDPDHLGLSQQFGPDARHALFDTALTGNHNTGHDFETDLPRSDKDALIAFLKSLKEGDQEKLHDEFKAGIKK